MEKRKMQQKNKVNIPKEYAESLGLRKGTPVNVVCIGKSIYISKKSR